MGFSSKSNIETAGGFTTGGVYTIISAGNTDFTLIGASDNNIGTTFTATGPGIGTGTASQIQLIVNVNGTLTNMQLSNGWTTGNDAVDPYP